MRLYEFWLSNCDRGQIRILADFLRARRYNGARGTGGACGGRGRGGSLASEEQAFYARGATEGVSGGWVLGRVLRFGFARFAGR